MAYERRPQREGEEGAGEAPVRRRRSVGEEGEAPRRRPSGEEGGPRRRSESILESPSSEFITPEEGIPAPAPVKKAYNPPEPKFRTGEDGEVDDSLDVSNVDPSLFEGKQLMTKADVMAMMGEAKDMDASDVHISVMRPPSCRIHGEMMIMPGYAALTPKDTKVVVHEAVPEQKHAELEEKGEYDCSYSVPGVGRFRVNAFRQRGSYSMVARLVNSEVPAPEKLGLPESLMNMCKRKRGMVLVTGPTGSGKSTTLSVLIALINQTRYGHIITMEDPIEFLHNHDKCVVNQREMGMDSNSYKTALRAALRQDPDVILVGEMRDLETIEIAVTAAETGHLVFSTLHTIGAAATIDRVLDVFPPHQQNQVRSQLAEVIQCVCSQQLMPKVGGGRVAALEIMIANAAIKNNIREGKIHQIASAMQTGKKAGMITMDDSIMNLFNEGKITKEVAMEFAQDPVAMEVKLR